MAAAFGPVQWLSKAGNAASITTTATTTTTGNLLVVCIACFTNKIGATPITDSKGNTWVAAISSTGTTNGFGAMYYVANCTGGASHTFTFTPTGSDFIAMSVIEISGAALSSVLGSTATSTTTGSATHTAGSITSNSSVAEIFIGFCTDSHNAPPSITGTDPATWATIAAINGAVTEGIIAGFRIVSPSFTDTFSCTSSALNEMAGIAGFKAAVVASGAGGSFTFFGA